MNLPQVGLLVFVVLLTFSFFVTSRRHLQALGAALFFGALGAAGLIYAQASISTFCLYCMTVDLSTIVAAIAVMFIVAKTPSDEAFDALVKPSMRWEIALRWALAGAVAIAAPFMWARYPVVPPVPAPIAALQVPGKTTVVSFTDFQCPYCRQTQPILEQIEKRPDVEFHRFMAPLELHPGAEPAALAYLCAPEKSRDALATLFYTAEEEKLTSTGVVEMASTLGLDGDAIAECMVHGKGPELLAADKKVYQDVGGAGLPTTYIGSNLIIGFDPDRYQRVLSHPGPRSFFPAGVGHVRADRVGDSLGRHFRRSLPTRRFRAAERGREEGRRRGRDAELAADVLAADRLEGW